MLIAIYTILRDWLRSNVKTDTLGEFGKGLVQDSRYIHTQILFRGNIFGKFGQQQTAHARQAFQLTGITSVVPHSAAIRDHHTHRNQHQQRTEQQCQPRKTRQVGLNNRGTAFEHLVVTYDIQDTYIDISAEIRIIYIIQSCVCTTRLATYAEHTFQNKVYTVGSVGVMYNIGRIALKRLGIQFIKVRIIHRIILINLSNRTIQHLYSTSVVSKLSQTRCIYRHSLNHHIIVPGCFKIIYRSTSKIKRNVLDIYRTWCKSIELFRRLFIPLFKNNIPTQGYCK